MRAIGFAGWSGSGKTTLIEQLIPLLIAAGQRVSVIKHAHHKVDVDQPGKDSWRHREAGAAEVLLTTDRRWVLMHELRGQPEPGIHQHLARLSPCDLVLVEGFKAAAIPKIEVHRPATGKPLLHPDDPWIVAIACDTALDVPLPVLDLNDPAAVARFILTLPATGAVPDASGTSVVPAATDGRGGSAAAARADAAAPPVASAPAVAPGASVVPNNR